MAEAATQQLELESPLVAGLDISRGVLSDYTYEDLVDIGPDSRIGLTALATGLGNIALPPTYRAQLAALRIDEGDVCRAQNLTFQQHCLYIWPDDPRYRTAEQLVKVESQAGVDQAIREGIWLPYRLRITPGGYVKQPGVVFPEDELTQFSYNPAGLVFTGQRKVRHAHADARPGDPDYIDRDEVTRRSESSVARSTNSYSEKALALDKKLVQDRRLLISLRRQLRGRDPRTNMPIGRYKAKNLDKARLHAEELFSRTTETVAINAGLTDREVSALHRGRVRELFGQYLSENATEEAWQRQIVMEGLYVNARRFKILQSAHSTMAYHASYRKSMREIFFAQRHLA